MATVLCSVIAGATLWHSFSVAGAASGGGNASSLADDIGIDVPQLLNSGTDYSASSQTVTLFDRVEGFKVSLPTGWTRNGTDVTLPPAASGGTYSIIVTPENGYYWNSDSDGDATEDTEKDTSGKTLNFRVNTVPVTTELFNLETNGTFDTNSIMRLMGKIIGKTTVVSYDEINSYFTNTERRRYGMDIGAEVLLGGLRWRVVFASKPDRGDVFVTLWLSNSSDAVKWTNWSNSSESTSDSVTYPANMYSTSFIRSYLTGSNYSVSSSELSSSGAQSDIWSNFLKNYRNYILSPAEVSYQSNFTGYANEGYGANDVYSNINGYNDWRNDKLWLPSYTEVGTANTNGYWGIERSVCFNGVHWLRSGSADDERYAYYTINDSPYDTTDNDKYTVRPALHLNLSRLVNNTGLVLNDPGLTADTLTYSEGVQSIVITSIANMTIKLTDEMVRDGWYIVNSTIYAPAGADVSDKYSVSFTPAAGYSWRNGGNEEKTISIRIVKKAIQKPTVAGYNAESNPVPGLTYNSTEQTVTLSGFDSGTMSVLNNTDTRINVGNYRVLIQLKDKKNYRWQSVSDSNDTADLSLPWKIVPKTINTEFAYSGDIRYGSLSSAPEVSNMEGNGTVVWSIPDSYKKIAEIDSVTGIIKPLTVGKIKVVMTVTGTLNYAERIVTSDEIEIKKAQVARPSVEGQLVYNDAEQSVMVTNYNPHIMEFYDDGKGTYKQKATNVGKYKVCIMLTDTTHYEWVDGKSGNSVIDWEIISRLSDITVLAPELVTTNIKYSPDKQYVALANVTGWSFTLPDGWSFVPGTALICIPANAQAIAYRIQFTLKDNYSTEVPQDKWYLDISVGKADPNSDFRYGDVILKQNAMPTVTNCPANVQVRWSVNIDGISASEAGSATINEANGTLMSTRAGIVRVIMTIPASDYYNGQTIEKLVTIGKIKLTKPTVKRTDETAVDFVYDGETKNICPSSNVSLKLQGFDGKLMGVVGDSGKAINAGIYLVEIGLLDPQNYQWDDLSYDNLLLEWRIGQATPSVEVRVDKKTYYLGDRLNTVTYVGEATTAQGLPIEGVFVWVNPSAELINTTGTYAWSFTPNSENYKAAEGIVTVTAAEPFTSLSWSGNVKTQYTAFETFDSANLAVTAIFKGVSTPIYEYTLKMPYGAQRNHLLRIDNEKYVTISYTFTNGSHSTTLSTTIQLSVDFATYDLSGAYLAYDGSEYDTDFVYEIDKTTGKPKVFTVEIKGLPEGVRITKYSNDSTLSASERGGYSVEALEFNYDTANYNAPVLTKKFLWRISEIKGACSFGITGTITYGADALTITFDTNNTDSDCVITWEVNSVAEGDSEGGAAEIKDGKIYPTRAGKITVTMHVSGTTHYTSCYITHEFEIAQAEIDISGVKWVTTISFTYTGSSQGVTLTKIPNGIKPIYSGATATSVGDYTAKATFELDEKYFTDNKDLATNYKITGEFTKTCSWSITKADISKVNNITITVKDTENIIYSGNPLMPDFDISLIGLTKGECDVSYKNNIFANEDSKVKAELTVTAKATASNYSGSRTVYFTIKRADYTDFVNVKWEGPSSDIFDGNPKYVNLTGLPDGVEVEKFANGSATNVGKYTASVASFIYDDENYNAPVLPEDIASFEWSIEACHIDSSQINWSFKDGTQWTAGQKPESNVFTAYAYIGGKQYIFNLKYSKIDGGENDWSAGIYEVTLDLSDQEKSNFEFSGNISQKVQLVNAVNGGGDNSSGRITDDPGWVWKLSLIIALAVVALIVLIVLVVTISKRRTKVIVNEPDDSDGFYDNIYE